MKLMLKRLEIENFKGIKKQEIDFGNKSIVSGQNATGKTSIMDAFTWLLFGKDSKGSEKFAVRPNDAKGVRVDNVVIKVSGIFDADGKELLLTKTQEQKWVKRRGSDVTELQGNENKYEINEIPKTEKDYKTYISDMIEEELLKMLTSPQVFASMDWKKQREILLKLVSEITDADVIATDDKFKSLDKLLEDATVEDLTAKTKKALSSLKKTQAELPARIDEVSKSIVEVDLSEQEIAKNKLLEQLSTVEAQLDDASKAGDIVSDIQAEIMQASLDIGEVTRIANEKIIQGHRDAQEQIDNVSNDLKENNRERKLLESDLDCCKKSLAATTENREVLLREYEQIKSSEISGESLICPVCNQDLPLDKREKAILDFNKNRDKYLNEVVTKGKAATKKIESLKERIETIQLQIYESEQSEIKFNDLMTIRVAEAEKVPKEADLSSNEEYIALLSKKTDLEEQISSMDSGEDYRTQLKARRTEIQKEMEEIDKSFSITDSNKRAQERIAKLQTEQREVGQKVANQEKGLFLLEEFIKAKMDLLSSKINSRFKIVNFRLFENQINGGYKGTCECMVNGVTFSNLNDSHKVVAGLDIISTLQEIYGIHAPIFIDNSESVNDFNIPSMDSQLILLKVSEDKKLKVEV